MGERVGEGRQQHPRPGVGSGEMGGAMQRDDGLAGPGRARDAGGPGEIAGDERRLRGMQEDGPFLPRLVERATQGLDVAKNAEAALRVGMGERVGFDGLRLRRFGLLSDRELQQRFLRLLRHMGDHVEQRVLVGRADVVDPFLRHAEGHQLDLAQVAEQLRFRCARGRFDGSGDKDGISSTRSRTSTSCIAPVVGWRSILRRSAHL